MKKAAIAFLSICTFLVGAFYGLVSAQVYEEVLIKSINCETASLLCSAYSFKLLRRPWKFIFVGVFILSSLVIAQALSRLIR